MERLTEMLRIRVTPKDRAAFAAAAAAEGLSMSLWARLHLKRLAANDRNMLRELANQ